MLITQLRILIDWGGVWGVLVDVAAHFVVPVKWTGQATPSFNR